MTTPPPSPSPSGPPPSGPPPLLLAHRGAARHETADSAEAYALALRLGAHGVLTTVSTGPGGPVVGAAPRRFRKSPPPPVELAALLGLVRADAAPLTALLVLPVGDDAVEVGAAALDVARRAGALERMWLAAERLDALVALRETSPAVRLLYRSAPGDGAHGPERHAARLREAAVDGLLCEEAVMSAGLVALVHRFGRLVVVEGADHERTARRGLAHGVDGVAGADVEALVAASR